MAEVIGVSEAQLRFVTNTQSGMGLMKCGNVVIPFLTTRLKKEQTFTTSTTQIFMKNCLREKQNAVDIG